MTRTFTSQISWMIEANHLHAFRQKPSLILSMVRFKKLRLLSLPNEILTMICAETELSSTDLAAIRMTCKKLYAIASKEFAQRYFQDPFVMISRKSLETLVEICKHPFFGPQIREIRLLNNFFNRRASVSFAAELAYVYFKEDKEKRATAKRRLEQVIDLVAEQYDMVESGIDLELLTKAFEALSAQGRSVAIASQSFHQSHPPLGWSEIARNFDRARISVLLWKPEVLSTTSTLLRTAQAGACTATKLAVGVNWSHHVDDKPISRLGLDRSLLLNLLEFDFQFQWLARGNLQNNLAYKNLEILLQILPTKLKTFVMGSDAEITSGTVADSIHWPLKEALRFNALADMQPDALENIHLSKIILRQNNLLPFLDTHRKTLKKLKLNTVYLEGDWDQILSYIAAKFSLEQFSLSKAQKVIEIRDVLGH
ncbi:hypothetical protein E4T48_07178 [Aureobasidium sp. EXF-10727]|nr:hypothetical protein E4T48_07178 [Aureobasidium sp. EXF-10727]